MTTRSFAGYSIIRMLGDGGMTRLLLALDEQGQRVVVRYLKEEYARRWRYRRHFRQGAKVLATLHHTNIVQLIKTGQEGHIPFMVLEYVEACSLRELIMNRSPLLLKAALPMIRQMAALLAFVHGAGYIHLDLKPENILVQKDGAVYLIDFDLAQQRRWRPFRLWDLPGTPAYIAPETLLRHQVDERSDIYGLGVVFYEILTFHKPYEGTHIDQVRADQVNPTVPPTRPRYYEPAIPVALETIILKCIAKRSEDRYPSISLVIRDLEALI
ncbi:MAG: serine/threonine-protein kinase [Kiritimatiellaeota bacterium]|nr:serine/threonine-protein kinase [Kiritimatiellota bacterium]